MKTSKITLHILFWVVSLIIVYFIYAVLRPFIYDIPFLIENWQIVFNPTPEVVLWLIILNFGINLYFLFPLWSFRMFLKNLQTSQTFAEENISLLKKFSNGLLIFLTVRILIDTVWRLLANIVDIYGNEVPIQYPFYIAIFLFALSVRVILHLLSSGLRLKQENDLTI